MGTTRFKSPEEVREYLRSEWSRTDSSVVERMRNIHEVLHSLQSESSEIDFEEVVSPFIEQWRSDNPGLAQDLDRMSAQVLSVMREAARGLELMFIQISAEVNQWMRNNPEALRKLVVILRILAADGIAAGWQKRSEEEGVAIPPEIHWSERKVSSGPSVEGRTLAQSGPSGWPPIAVEGVYRETKPWAENGHPGPSAMQERQFRSTSADWL